MAIFGYMLGAIILAPIVVAITIATTMQKATRDRNKARDEVFVPEEEEAPMNQFQRNVKAINDALAQFVADNYPSAKDFRVLGTVQNFMSTKECILIVDGKSTRIILEKGFYGPEIKKKRTAPKSFPRRNFTIPDNKPIPEIPEEPEDNTPAFEKWFKSVKEKIDKAIENVEMDHYVPLDKVLLPPLDLDETATFLNKQGYVAYVMEDTLAVQGGA